MVVQRRVAIQTSLGFVQVRIVVQLDLFVFHAAPQTLDENVVKTASAPVHVDANPGPVEPAREVIAGERAALVGVEDLGCARVESLDECTNAKRGV